MNDISKYKTGDIFHCTGHSWISKGIKFFTKSNITHSAVFIEVWGHPYIFDSQNDGTNLRPFDAWVEKFGYEYEVTRAPFDVDEKRFAVNALSLSGHTAYDFKLFVIRYPHKIIWSWLTGKPLVMKAEKNEKDRMICSESVAWEYGLPNPQNFLPKTLHEYCIENNWIKIL